VAPRRRAPDSASRARASPSHHHAGRDAGATVTAKTENGTAATPAVSTLPSTETSWTSRRASARTCSRARPYS
jgi:hypothetical protein